MTIILHFVFRSMILSFLTADAILVAIVAVECLCVLAIAGIFVAQQGGRPALAVATPRGDEAQRRSDSFETTAIQP